MSPARRRSRENSEPKQTRAAGSAKAGKRRVSANPKNKASKHVPKKKGQRSLPDPSDTPDSEVRFIQPYDATKEYLCPGCGRDIPVGLGHVVAVPPGAADLRRHWHRGCWDSRGSHR